MIGRLRELDAEADKMLMIWVQEGVISDREMARRLGRKQSTFAKQINRIRMELRKHWTKAQLKKQIDNYD